MNIGYDESMAFSSAVLKSDLFVRYFFRHNPDSTVIPNRQDYTMASESPEEIDLPIIATEENAIYRCPGESASITRIVHLARMESNWHGCRDCVWNDAPTVGKDSQPHIPADAGAIRRTSCGVRGAYLNAMDRFRAAQLAAILASHISRVAFVRSAVGMLSTEGISASTSTAGICIGYDGRIGSQDLFAGVVSAVLQNGCDVIDVGRCTTASLLSACRSQPNTAGCLMITGAGAKAGDVGIDVFGGDGRSLSVPWTDFGVGVRMPPAPGPALDSVSADESAAGALNRIGAALPTGSPQSLTSDMDAILDLPGLSDSSQLFRSGRSSGTLSNIELENHYRNWLARWWPQASIEPTCFYTHDDFASERLQNLTTDEPKIQFRTGGFDGSGCRGLFTFEISEDDRYLQTYSKSGRRIPADELTNWINQASRTTSSHVTAHPTDDKKNVLLVDVASPGTQRTHEIICDAFVVAGLVLNLACNPKNQFPA